MGIGGLNSFVRQFEGVVVDDKLCDTHIIVDGCNVHHGLVRSFGHADAFKDDYCAMEKHFEEFFSKLQKCNVSPIVVVDGASDLSEKFETQMGRMRKAIRDCVDWSDPSMDYDSALERAQIPPPFTTVVFRHVLNGLGVRLIQTNGEADACVAHLARQYDCPVLSDDSDFMVFENDLVFISDLATQPSSAWHPYNKEKKCYWLPCKKFRIKAFMDVFPMRESRFLHLAATLIGNDFGQGMNFDAFFRDIQLPLAPHGRARLARIEGILIWLGKQQSLKGSVCEIVSVLKKAGDEMSACTDLTSLLWAAIDKYDVDAEARLALNQSPENLVVRAQKWFSYEMRIGHLSSWILDMFFNGEVFLRGQLEVRDEVSCHIFALPILKTTCGLVTSLWIERKESIILHYRDGTEVATLVLDVAEFPPFDLPLLRQEVSIDLNNGWEWLYKHFKVSEKCLSRLRNLTCNSDRLFFLGLYLWSQRSGSTLSKDFISTIVFGVYCHCVRKCLKVPSSNNKRTRPLALPMGKLRHMHELREECNYVQTIGNLHQTFIHLYTLFQLVFGFEQCRKEDIEIFHLWDGPLMYKLHCHINGHSDVRARMQQLIPFGQCEREEFEQLLLVVQDCTSQ